MRESVYSLLSEFYVRKLRWCSHMLSHDQYWHQSSNLLSHWAGLSTNLQYGDNSMIVGIISSAFVMCLSKFYVISLLTVRNKFNALILAGIRLASDTAQKQVISWVSSYWVAYLTSIIQVKGLRPHCRSILVIQQLRSDWRKCNEWFCTWCSRYFVEY